MKIGVFIDAENIRRSGGYGIRYDVLRDYISQFGDPIRLNSYMSIDESRMRTDYEYKDRTNGFLSIVRSYGFKVITKAIRWFEDEDGQRIGKANADLDMAVDILLQSQHMDTIYLLTGDGDFKRVVQAIQNMGIRVEVIAFRYISRDLLHEADQFTSGYLVPNLLPVPDQRPEDWGAIGTRARGYCYSVQDGYGFMKYLDIDMHTWRDIFFHFSQLPERHYVNLDDVFEFTIEESGRSEGGILATNMALLHTRHFYQEKTEKTPVAQPIV
ncbi:MAG TPA: NYN domain-containing protein [Saprospiraceae bacterium]|nr:NYN domain-containing protein [Saprospiraceae bacterium]